MNETPDAGDANARPRTITDAEAGAISDAEAVERVLAGERAVFAVLMRRYNQRVFRVTRAILGDDADAEDAMQTAYLAAFRSLSGFAWESSFATWLTCIARNEALGRLRQRKRRAEVELAEGMEVSMSGKAASERSPEATASARQIVALVENAIDELPEIYRVVFVLREVEGLDTAESAACLGVTEEVVKVRLHRARAQLRASVLDRVDASASEAFVFLGARCDRMVARVLAAIGAV